MVRSWSVTARGLASVQVVGRNWIVALGRGLEELGRADSLMRLACEVLPNGTVIARDITSGTGYIVQAIGEVDLNRTHPPGEPGSSEADAQTPLPQLADDVTMEFPLGEDTPAPPEGDEPQEEIEAPEGLPSEPVAADAGEAEPIAADAGEAEPEPPEPVPEASLPHEETPPPGLAIGQVAAESFGVPISLELAPVSLPPAASPRAPAQAEADGSAWVTPPTEERLDSHRPAPPAPSDATGADATEAEEAEVEPIFELPEDAIREIGPAEDPGWPILHAETVMQACERALGAARAACGAESGAVILAERGYLRFIAVSGPHATRLMGTRLPLGTGVAGFALERKRTVVLADAHADPRHCGEVDALTGYVTREIAVLPLVLDGVALGVLELMNLPEGRRFTKADMDTLMPLADALAIRIGR